MLPVFLMGEKCRGEAEFEVSVEHGLDLMRCHSGDVCTAGANLRSTLKSEPSRTEFALTVKV